MERYIVVDNYCGWPKLTLMPDDSINMNMHNRPSHGSADGYVECWKSTDGGRSFKFAGVPVYPEKGEARIDEAAGLAFNGDYLTIVDRRGTADKTPSMARSEDGGKTYQITHKQFRLAETGDTTCLFPYGSIVKAGRSRLAFNFWTPLGQKNYKGFGTDEHVSHACVSDNDGHTWKAGVIDRGINETALLFYNDLHGIAVARIDAGGKGDGTRPDSGGGMRLYRTGDGGMTWTFESQIISACMFPAHLLQLADGETLMTYGFRFANMHGIMAQLSNDHGRTWSEPNVLVHYPAVDSGYPSSVQLADGSLVTAYYCSGCPQHNRYHVGVLKWKLTDLLESRWIGRPARFRRGTDREVTDWSD